MKKLQALLMRIFIGAALTNPANAFSTNLSEKEVFKDNSLSSPKACHSICRRGPTGPRGPTGLAGIPGTSPLALFAQGFTVLPQNLPFVDLTSPSQHFISFETRDTSSPADISFFDLPNPDQGTVIVFKMPGTYLVEFYTTVKNQAPHIMYNLGLFTGTNGEKPNTLLTGNLFSGGVDSMGYPLGLISGSVVLTAAEEDTLAFGNTIPGSTATLQTYHYISGTTNIASTSASVRIIKLKLRSLKR